MLCDFLEPVFRGSDALFTLKTKGSRYHCYGQNTELTRYLSNNRCGACARATAHAGRHKHHIGAM